VQASNAMTKAIDPQHLMADLQLTGSRAQQNDQMGYA
jgi:hypothetical protein